MRVARRSAVCSADLVRTLRVEIIIDLFEVDPSALFFGRTWVGPAVGHLYPAHAGLDARKPRKEGFYLASALL